MLDDPLVAEVQVESGQDAFDLELRSASGGILLAKQIKNRQLKDTWAPSDIYPILRGWAASDRQSDTHFDLILGGRLGDAGSSLRSAIMEAADGSTADLIQLAGENLTAAQVSACRHVRMVVDATPTEGILSHAVRQAMSMLVNPRTGLDAESEADDIVHRLYMLLMSRAGLPSEDQRVVTRRDVAELFGLDAECVSNWRWGPKLRQRYHSTVLELPFKESVEEDIRLLPSPLERAVGSLNTGTLMLANLLEVDDCILLAGQSGTGKSTAAETLRRLAAAQGSVVIVANTASYLPNRLGALVADALAQLINTPVPGSVGRAILGDVTVTIILDGVAELAEPLRRELSDDLRALIASGGGSKIILIGRDAAILNSVPPASSPRSAFVLRGIARSGREQLVRAVLSTLGEASHRRVQEVAAQAQYALGDAASIPYLLNMAAHLLGRGFPFDSRAQMYLVFIEEMARRAGVVDLQLSLLSLGVAFAELLDMGQRQCEQFEWKQLLFRASETMAASHISISPERIEQAALRGGFVAAENYLQIMFPAHDSLADFFAAFAHSKKIASLPADLTVNDTLRAIFLSEMSGVSFDLGDKIARNLPFIAISVAKNDKDIHVEDGPSYALHLVNTFARSHDIESICMWKGDDKAKYLVLNSGSESKWISEDDGLERAASHRVLEFQGGPFSAAVAVWKLILKGALTHTDSGWAVPTSSDSAVEAIVRHTESTKDAVTHLVTSLIGERWQELVLDMTTPPPLSIVVSPEPQASTPYWPISYRKSETERYDVHIGRLEEWEKSGQRSGWGSIDSILRNSPRDTARDLVKAAINELVDIPWLD
ncbi:hypothetical protein ACFU44_21070 [Nocardia rhizosphaerihabitans]|uniref:hypothetical protein n=1 Tax=Nocardia rhizosphaerihabitans TaxID=1691570 RepID=UPI0036729C7F